MNVIQGFKKAANFYANLHATNKHKNDEVVVKSVFKTGLTAACLAAMALTASTLSQAANTEIANGMTLPSGVVKAGNDIWVSDHLLGFCRLALVDGGVGKVDTSSCSSVVVSPGQAVFVKTSMDPAPLAGFMFVPDNSSKGVGVWRFAYANGQISDPVMMANGIIKGNRPAAVAYDPAKQSLYVSLLKNTTIVRIDKVLEPVDKLSAQTAVAVGVTADRRGPPALTMLGGDLFLAEVVGVSRISNVSACPGSGTAACTAKTFPSGVSAPIYVAADNTSLYIADLNNAYRFSNNCVAKLGTGFRGVSSVGILSAGDTKLYVGDDPTLGAQIMGASVYELASSPDDGTACTSVGGATGGTAGGATGGTTTGSTPPTSTYPIAQVSNNETLPGAMIQIGAETWISDHTLGFCRLTVTGIVPSSCNRAALSPGQAVFVPGPEVSGSTAVTGYVYVPDNSSKGAGVYRLDYQNGAIVSSTLLRNDGINGNRPTAVAVSASGDLYVSLIKNNSIMRITNPSGAVTAQTSRSVGFASGRIGPPAMATVKTSATSTDLYLAESGGITKLTGIENCSSTNPGFCTARGFPAGVTVPVYVAADQKGLFIGDLTTAYRFDFASSSLSALASNFSNLSGIGSFVSTDPMAPSSSLFIGDDTSAGNAVGQGRVWKLSLPSAASTSTAP